MRSLLKPDIMNNYTINSCSLLMKKKYKIAIVVIICVVAFFLLRKKKNGDQEPIVTEAPIREDITQTLEVSGFIDATEKVSLRFIAGGKIVKLGAKEGDVVKKGQTIAVIDQRDLQKRLTTSLNNYMKERWDHEQYQDDNDGKYQSTEQIRDQEQEQWDLENSVISVEIADIAVSNTVMSAPFSGILVKTPVNVSNVIVTATNTFDIVNPTSITFKALVDEADIGLITKHQIGHIVLDSYEDEAFDSYVDYVAYLSTISSGSTVFEVHFPIANANLDKFRIGMNGEITIDIDKKQNVLTIPLLATKEKNGGTYVDVQDSNGEIKEVEITIGLESEEKVEVVSGLSESDQVVIPE